MAQQINRYNPSTGACSVSLLDSLNLSLIDKDIEFTEGYGGIATIYHNYKGEVITRDLSIGLLTSMTQDQFARFQVDLMVYTYTKYLNERYIEPIVDISTYEEVLKEFEKEWAK